MTTIDKKEATRLKRLGTPVPTIARIFGIENKEVRAALANLSSAKKRRELELENNCVEKIMLLGSVKERVAKKIFFAVRKEMEGK